ncbi:hypothetical protein FEM48_Zijuj02G0116400 [Ziziphus jujuba var. spinosa]|uniref:Extra-large guanine nucleotide-binding protein 3-like n=1 Tax=Ziziphus jujuba var. spinosa TaxID=714518 RepID=A0A978VVI4_ZIZJJ|nr:hypothetical protein FEM48_Zijuj02G0116400 [Ziziphus jujuba var. spinosa]
MGEKGRIQLEELYSGIPDESVDLTFQDLAEVKHKAISPEKRRPPIGMERIPEATRNMENMSVEGSPMIRKMPSLDFNRALQATTNNQQQRQPRLVDGETNHFEHAARSVQYGGNNKEAAAAAAAASHNRHGTSPFSEFGFRQAVENSMAYGDVSMVSTYQDQRGIRRRPGIPHSNICTICSTSIFLFKNRCLVCGRVYCRECVGIGMGNMTEGRKCVECLGRRFSQRYIQKAGEAGCFCWRYPTLVMQAELKWAEKGPRRNGERGYDRRAMMSSTARSPMTAIQMMPSTAHSSGNPDSFFQKSPRTPTRANNQRSPMIPSRASGSSNPNSFVTSGSYSPYSPAHLHLPF